MMDDPTDTLVFVQYELICFVRRGSFDSFYFCLQFMSQYSFRYLHIKQRYLKRIAIKVNFHSYLLFPRLRESRQCKYYPRFACIKVTLRLHFCNLEGAYQYTRNSLFFYQIKIITRSSSISK